MESVKNLLLFRDDIKVDDDTYVQAFIGWVPKVTALHLASHYNGETIRFIFKNLINLETLSTSYFPLEYFVDSGDVQFPKLKSLNIREFNVEAINGRQLDKTRTNSQITELSINSMSTILRSFDDPISLMGSFLESLNLEVLNIGEKFQCIEELVELHASVVCFENSK